MLALVTSPTTGLPPAGGVEYPRTAEQAQIAASTAGAGSMPELPYEPMPNGVAAPPGLTVSLIPLLFVAVVLYFIFRK